MKPLVYEDTPKEPRAHMKLLDSASILLELQVHVQILVGTRVMRRMSASEDIPSEQPVHLQGPENILTEQGVHVQAPAERRVHARAPTDNPTLILGRPGCTRIGRMGIRPARLGAPLDLVVLGI